MIHFTVLCVGTVKEKYMRDAIDDYKKRLTKYAKVDVIEVAEQATVEKEGALLLAKIPERAYVTALDLKGEQMTSPELAAKIDKQAAEGYSHFIYMIGGSDGLAAEVTQKANARLCMGKMTFPHQMARLIIFEQLYRAMKINHGEKYHK